MHGYIDEGLEDVEAIINANEYDRVKSIVNNVSFPEYQFHITMNDGIVSIYVTYKEEDVDTGRLETQYCRQWSFPFGQTEGQIVGTCLKAILTSMEHRVREHFLYKDKVVFCPHMDIEDLLKIAPKR